MREAAIMIVISILMVGARAIADEANSGSTRLKEEKRSHILHKGFELGMSVGKLRGLGVQLLHTNREDFDPGRDSKERTIAKEDVYVERDNEANEPNAEMVYRTYIFSDDKCECMGVGKRVKKAQYARSVIQDINSLAEMYGYDAPKRRIKQDILNKQLRPCLIWDMKDRVVVLDWTSEKDIAESGEYGTIQLLIRSHNFEGSRFTESDLYKKYFSPVGDRDELFHFSGFIPPEIKQIVNPIKKSAEDTGKPK